RVGRLVRSREDAVVGAGSIIGAGVYVGAGVRLGRNCKVQNNALLYEGVQLEDGVFVGPQVCFTNDFLPRAVNPDLSLKAAEDWQEGRILVREGASVGAQPVGGNQGGAGAGKGIEHQVLGIAVNLDQAPRQLFRERGWVAHATRVGAGEVPYAERPGQELVAGDVAAAALRGSAEGTPLVEDGDHLDGGRDERRRGRQPRAPGRAAADVLLVPHD